MADTPIPRLIADEVTTGIHFLDHLRHSILAKLDGLDDSDLRRQLVDSDTTLLGLIQHLTMAECFWFEIVLNGAGTELPDGSMIVDDNISASSVTDAYRAQTARNNQIVATRDPDDLPATTLDGDPASVRWILHHMIEETARHAGHADIVRELIDGRTGR